MLVNSASVPSRPLVCLQSVNNTSYIYIRQLFAGGGGVFTFADEEWRFEVIGLCGVDGLAIQTPL